MQEIHDSLWKQFDLKTHLANELLPAEKLAEQRPVFPGFQQIVPGTYWSEEDGCLKLDLYKPQRLECDLNAFIDLSARYFESLNAKRIGVHLSGGLDSSIIICLLKALGMPFVVIGGKTDRFEFRTERHIQETLLNYGSDGLLIDIDQHLFYSNLTDIPQHQMPIGGIKSNALDACLANEFAKRGCDVVLSGQGGDTLLCDAISDLSDCEYNIGNEFGNPEAAEFYYKPRGIRLLSFFAHKPIIDALSTAAIGRKDDAWKLWGRKWFAPILPKELANYHYVADFFGISMSGLDAARPTIKRLFDEAFDLTSDEHFAPANVTRFLAQDVFSFEHAEYIKYCSLISVAVWLHSLFNNG
jgi:asparagine synthetase B (glutamine-hydrolysing)